MGTATYDNAGRKAPTRGAPRRLVEDIGRLVERIGAKPDDTDDVRLYKRVLVVFASMGLVAGTLWGILYTALGEPLAGSIPLAYAVITFLSMVIFSLTRRYHFFRFGQLLLLLLLPFVLMLTLGGFVSGSAVMLWSLISPLAALMVTERRQAVGWFLAFLGLAAISGMLEPYARDTNNLSTTTITVLFAMNIAGVSVVVFVLVHFFVGQKNTALRLLHQEQDKSENLLLNVLPAEIAAVLKDGSRTIADHYEAVSVLFADVVGFTPLSAKIAPGEMVELLNEVFSYFDSLVEKYGLEKIRTIGDNYMVASGVPRPRRDHAQAEVS